MTKPNTLKRFSATVIDSSLFMVVGIPLIFAADNNGYMAWLVGLLWLSYVVISEGYLGGTPGHRIIGLKVISVDESKLTVARTLKRRLMDVVDFLGFGVIAISLTLATSRHQRLGDLWARTIVVDLSDPQQTVETMPVS